LIHYGKDTLGQEDFMRLLLKELSHQDPLNPMDSKEFTVQLTQFSSLEGIAEINNNLDDLLTYQRSMQNTTVTNMIGKTVEVDGNSTQLNGSAAMSYDLAGDASSVAIQILDNTGKLVRSEALGSQTAGSNYYIWDGKDNLGEQLPDGPYTFEIEALDSQGGFVDVGTNSAGHVTGVQFDDALTYLVLDNARRVNLNDVKSIVE
jgi:flagellar basal-body rod modification protein FlgD